MSEEVTYIDARAVEGALSPKEAVDALRATLQSGFDPADDHSRIVEPLSNGEFLLMPSETGSDTGIKVLTVTPENPQAQLPRIQGLYILLDAQTHRPRGLIDGPSLTDLRTPAVSIAAVSELITASADPLDIVLYGAGHQGLAHLRTIEDVLNGIREISSVTAVVRHPERVEPHESITRVLASDSAEAHAATAQAHLVVCTTTAREPLFESDLIRDDAVIIAVGSHEPGARELPGELVGRSHVIVEDISTALRECGDVVMAISEGHLSASSLIPMSEVVTGSRDVGTAGRPTVFKSSGMSWEDLVLAAEIVSRTNGGGRCSS